MSEEAARHQASRRASTGNSAAACLVASPQQFAPQETWSYQDLERTIGSECLLGMLVQVSRTSSLARVAQRERLAFGSLQQALVC